MNAGKLIRFLKDDKASICAAGAVVGVFVTAYFSGKAAVEVSNNVDPEDSTSEKVTKYAKAYWKTGLSAAATCGLIISCNKIHLGSEAAIAGVAAIWKAKAVDLDNALVKEVGEERAHEIHNEIVQEKIKNDKENRPDKFPSTKQDGSMSSKMLVYEPYTDQYFYTTRETIAWAMLEANKRLMNQYDVRLNYIIGLLGGKATPEGDKIGWNWENDTQDYAWSYYGGPWIEIMPDIRTYNDGTQAFVLFYQVDPEPQGPDDMIYKEGV